MHYPVSRNKSFAERLIHEIKHSRDLLSPPRDLFTYLGLQLFSGAGDK